MVNHYRKPDLRIVRKRYKMRRACSQGESSSIPPHKQCSGGGIHGSTVRNGGLDWRRKFHGVVPSRIHNVWAPIGPLLVLVRFSIAISDPWASVVGAQQELSQPCTVAVSDPRCAIKLSPTKFFILVSGKTFSPPVALGGGFFGVYGVVSIAS